MGTLKKVISGGQCGADQAGLYVAKRFGLETGGVMPKGYTTLDGSGALIAKEYGLTENSTDSYAARTYQNVKDSHGTVRLAGNFSSKGEICTLNAIKKYNKPYFDVDLTDPPPIQEFIQWIENNKIVVLNVAGNSANTYENCYCRTCNYLESTFFEMGMEMQITETEILGHRKNVGVYIDGKRLKHKILIKKA
jgi:hypothetical protein